MKTTYYIENCNSEVLNYFSYLRDAKRVLKSLNSEDYRIVCLKGPYKYEGRHVYYMQYSPKKERFYRKY